MPARRTDERQGGFTLLELLVVLALIALALTLVRPDLARSGRASLDAEVRSAATLLNQARRLAIVQGAELQVVLEAAAAEEAPPDAALYWSSEALQLAFQGPGEETHEPGSRIDLQFRPQGSSGGSVHFLASDYHARIDVDPFSGRATLVLRAEDADVAY